MHGVSEVIAIILILMITIAIAGLAYTFMSSTMSSTTSAASSSVSSTTASMMTSFSIESVDENIIYIRNTGQNALSNISVYVNDLPVRYNLTPVNLIAGTVGTVAINDFVKTGDTVKISTTNGFSAARVFIDQCYGAIACWRFDEVSGPVAQDSSENRNDGNLVNMNIVGNSTSGWASGRFGGSLLFDGINDYVNAGNSSDLTMATNDFTISAWIKTATKSVYQYIVTKGDVSSGLHYYLRLEQNTGKIQASIGAAQNIFVNSITDVSNNQWHHIAGVFSRTGNITIYINGIAESSAWIGDLRDISNTDNVSISSRLNGGNRGLYFNGTIDNVAIWNRALTAQEISMLYNSAVY